MKELFDEFGACLIGENSAFSFLCGENMSELSAFFQHKTVKAGEVLWEEGAPSDYVAIISSGKIEIKKKRQNPDLGIRLLKGMLLSVSVRLKKSFERLSKFF